MRATFALIASLLFTALAPADAHEGHSHDEPVRTLAPVAPRGEAQAGEFEVVALLGNGEVIVYLDRFATNEPVTNAEIEALTPAGSEKAVLNADGSYRVPAKWIDGRDHYDLIFTVTLGETSEVLPLTIVGAKPAAEQRAMSVSIWMAGLYAFLAALGFLGVIVAARLPDVSAR